MCLYSRLDVLTPSVLRITDSFALLNLMGMGQEKSENSQGFLCGTLCGIWELMSQNNSLSSIDGEGSNTSISAEVRQNPRMQNFQA